MSYRIRLAGSDAAFDVAADETVLQAALRAGVALAHDCQLGGCGTCRVRLIEGAVGYDEFPFALSEEEAAAGYALMCQARPTGDLVIEPAGATEPLPEPERHTAVIRALRMIGPRVAHLELEIPSAASLDWHPGQYMNVVLDDGSTRSFSMASPPRNGLADFHIRRFADGRFTGRALSATRPGDTLQVELPHGTFVLRREDDRPLLMVATGTGLAPIKAMLEALMDDPDCPPVSLFWGARTEADLYLNEEICTWANRFDDFSYTPVLSRPGGNWRGHRGHVQHHIVTEVADLADRAAYLCGSPAMIADTKKLLHANGVDIDRIYSEGFVQQMAPVP